MVTGIFRSATRPVRLATTGRAVDRRRGRRSLMQHSSAGMTWTEGAAALFTLGILMFFLFM
jgi:hypothetical protein